MGLFDVGENNVGQFGADNSNIIRYKQAAEYAEDARLYAIQAAESIIDADNLLNRAEEVLAEAKKVLDSVKDIGDEVNALETRVTTAEALANDAIVKAQEAINTTATIIATAKSYAESAQESSQSAQGFSQSAAQSAIAANNAVTQAQGYRDEADVFADEAETHVSEAETAATQANTQADRAKSEADRAAELIANIPGKETIDGFAKVYKNKDDALADVSERTLGDKVLVWEEENSIYSWYDITGTLDNKELTLNSSEKRLKTVNNVQPDEEGNIQITLPGGNPSLWLGETVLFQYDPDKNVSYPGLLPQDGREVNRADYPDLWSSIAQNYIPSVTEAEWQAGKSNCFSKGNGTTTFRVPKWSGEVLRTPNAEDEKGEIVAQIPYVVTVNGVAPNDTTGNVQIDAVTTDGMNSAITTATSDKASKGANSDITALSGLTVALSIPQGGTGAKTAAAARTNLGLDRLANENLFMNGNFALWQRGITFVNPPHFTPTVARWVFGQSSGSAEFTISRDDDVPNLQSAFSMKILTTKAYAPQTMDEAHIRHAIEGRYDAESVAGKVLTLSFWAKSNVIGKHGVVFVKPNSDRTEEYTFCGSYTITNADVWEYKTVLVDTTLCPNKTWYRGNEYSLKFRFTFYAGTGYSGTENTWNLGNFVGVTGGVNIAAQVNNYLKVSQVKLEASPYATPFIPEPISETVRKVNRYEYLLADNSGSSTAGSIGWTGYSSQANESSYSTIAYPVPMRKVPTITASGPWTYSGNTQQAMTFISGTTSSTVEFKGIAAGRTAVRSVNGCQILFDAEM